MAKVLGLRFSGAALGLLSAFLVARLSGPDGSGFYYLFISSIAGLGLFSRLGSDLGLMKRLAERTTKCSGNLIGLEVTGTIIRSSLIWVVFIGAILFFGRGLFGLLIETTDPGFFAIGVYLVGLPYLVLGISVHTLRGMHKQELATLCEAIMPQALFIVILLFFMGAGLSVFEIPWVYGAAITLSSSLTLFFLYRSGWIAPTSATEIFRIKRDLPFFWVSLFAFANQWLATYFVASVGSEYEAGLYATALKLVTVVTIIMSVLNGIYAPSFSADHSTGQLKKMHARAKQSCTVFAVIGGAFLLLLNLFADQILGAFGEAFKGSVGLIHILSAGYLISLLCGASGYLLMMSGHAASLRNLNGVLLIWTALLFPFMNFYLGIEGIAIVVALGVALNNLGAVILVKKRLGFWVWFAEATQTKIN